MKNDLQQSGLSDQKNAKGANRNDFSQGITKRLLDKYKPNTDIFSLKTVGKKEEQKRVA